MRGFSLPELLVTVGILSLLIAILLPPLQVAHKEATAARCAAQLKQIGIALQNARDDYKYYPLWDDNGSPIRFTWVDVLVQKRMLLDRRVAYCPDDPRPGDVNKARGAHFEVVYPGRPDQFGVDYSYGIAVPLSAGGWQWRPGLSDDARPRRFEDFDRYPGQRVLVADSNWSTIYNLSGNSLSGHDWSDPTQYDNMIEWRHYRQSANILYQDGHVARVVYDLAAAEPVNTANTFLWYPGESLYVNSESEYNHNFYPNCPPVNLETGESSGTFPPYVVPGYYTYYRLWTFAK